MAITPELQRQADRLSADHALEISRHTAPTHVSAPVEVAGIELGEAVRLDKISKDLKRGPSYSPRNRSPRTETSGNHVVSSAVQTVDGEETAAKLKRTHGEMSKSFMETPMSRSARSRTADRLDGIYRELGVDAQDRKAYRETIRQAEAPTVVFPDRPANPGQVVLIGEQTKNIAQQALEGLQRIRGYLKEAVQAKAKV